MIQARIETVLILSVLYSNKVGLLDFMIENYIRLFNGEMQVRLFAQNYEEFIKFPIKQDFATITKPITAGRITRSSIPITSTPNKYGSFFTPETSQIEEPSQFSVDENQVELPVVKEENPEEKPEEKIQEKSMNVISVLLHYNYVYNNHKKQFHLVRLQLLLLQVFRNWQLHF
ncbi:uncharacterized protein LOC136077998 [Hydra vulgaris]|uniref:Uncharacterized protein LOC136077998 n=1 Tax=Hydra vulgaris TaxID=6087 RepID=A0ABM4BHX9_HYDVU